jgi:hypothetical protein
MNRIVRKGVVLAAAAVLLIAATWYGSYDVQFDPRNRANDEDARNFIRGTVNASAQVVIWRANDSVTLCQGANCALWAYMPNGTWAFARAIDSRARPPEAWLERLFRWLLGVGPDPGSLYETSAYDGDGGFGSCLGFASRVSVTYYVDGFYRHGYINGVYAGSVLIGTTIRQADQTGPVGCA